MMPTATFNGDVLMMLDASSPVRSRGGSQQPQQLEELQRHPTEPGSRSASRAEGATAHPFAVVCCDCIHLNAFCTVVFLVVICRCLLVLTLWVGAHICMLCALALETN
jgi:hypothetical protein